MKEIRTVLTESSFSSLCKTGFIPVETNLGKIDLRFSRVDIKELSTGKILEKVQDDVKFLYALQDLGTDTIREIVKRSPLYSELSQEI